MGNFTEEEPSGQTRRDKVGSCQPGSRRREGHSSQRTLSEWGHRYSGAGWAEGVRGGWWEVEMMGGLGVKGL